MINKASSIENICKLTFDVSLLKSFIMDENQSCFLNQIYENILMNGKEFELIRDYVFKTENRFCL